LSASTATALELSMLATGFSYSAERRARQVKMISGMLPHMRDMRRVGSAALDLCAVAAGWVDGYIEHGSNWWDWAAAALIATEAGAVVRVPGPTGTPPPDDGLGADAVLAAAPGIATALGELARRYGAAQV
jgi:myo-inositol-1(or 4)-monophosphatase